MKNKIKTFIEKTIGSRKGITWMVMLLLIVSLIMGAVFGLLEITMWFDVLIGILCSTIVLVLGIVAVEKIKIWLKYGKDN